jgi:hypothetical protein
MPGYERRKVLGGRQVGHCRSEHRDGEPAWIGPAQRAEDVHAGDLADEQVGGDRQGDRAGYGTPAESFQPGRWRHAAVAEKLVPDLVQRTLGGAHGPPPPRRQGEWLQDGRDGGLVHRPVTGPQRCDCTTEPEREAPVESGVKARPVRH